MTKSALTDNSAAKPTKQRTKSCSQLAQYGHPAACVAQIDCN